MEKTQREVKFKVSMDDEQRKAGNAKEVKFIVDFKNTSQETLYTLAIAAQNIRWQSQIKSHWEEFTKGELPKVVEFGVPLFEGTRTRTIVKAVTEEDVNKFIADKTPLEKLNLAIDSIRAAGMEVPESLLEQLDTLEAEEERVAQEKYEAEVAAKLAEEV